MREIEKAAFDPRYAISGNLVELSRRELCELVAEICRRIRDDVGTEKYHGGVYPENISRGPDGSVAIGHGRRHDWSERELKYIAPEIYWNNRPCPQSDIYALGLILYYGASAGKLPFEEESSNAQLMRMSGKNIKAPPTSGVQLADIIEKCLRFKEGERYRSVEELAIALDYCEDNRILNSRPASEAIFRKEQTELTDMEELMLGIIEGGEEAWHTGENTADESGKQGAGNEDSRKRQKDACVAVDGKTEDEIFREAGLRRPEPVRKDKETQYDMSELFGLDEPDPRDPEELEEEEDIRVYEPGGKRGIPILTEETDPELAPVTLKKRPVNAKAAKKSASTTAAGRSTQGGASVRAGTKTKTKGTSAAASGSYRSRDDEEQGEEPRKRRPLLVVVMLLAVLLIAAVVANILINAFGNDNAGGSGGGTSTPISTPQTDQQTSAPTEPAETTDIGSILSEEQLQYQQQLLEQQAEQARLEAEQAAQATPTVDPSTLPHRYEAIRADVGWLEARDAAQARGGYLVTVNTSEELQQVIDLATEAGFDKIWIGGHRENGELVWESGETDIYYRWDDGEPSYTDGGDGAAEDYIMLWRRNGQWVYNDSRENPLTDYYGMYGGKIGYVVEYVG